MYAFLIEVSDRVHSVTAAVSKIALCPRTMNRHDHLDRSVAPKLFSASPHCLAHGLLSFLAELQRSRVMRITADVETRPESESEAPRFLSANK
jgi:hypothetical protein